MAQVVYTSLDINGSLVPDEAENILTTMAVENTSGDCTGLWTHPNNMLYQLAHTAVLIAFMSSDTTKGCLIFHILLVLGYLLLSTWAWAHLCAPDVFSWNFSFVLINIVQMFFLAYRLRPIKFSAELEDVYAALFQPIKLPRHTFKKLVSTEFCTVLTLHQGEAYATQEITKTDRLALLINGVAHVSCNGQFLHNIQEKQFLDSPEFEATSHGDERFKVSIVAGMPCRYIYWQRHTLEYLFVKEPYMANVMGHILGRDITNKLYSLNEKLKVNKGRRIDIRLPCVSTVARTGADLKSLGLHRQQLPDMTGSGLIMRSDEMEDSEEELSTDSSDENTLMCRNGITHVKVKSRLSSSSRSSCC